MYKQILVPVDIADPELAKPAIAAAVNMARGAGGAVRLVHVVPLTSGMLVEYVPADFEAEQRKAAEEALAEIARGSGLDGAQVSTRCARAASITRCWKRRKRSAPT